MIFGFKQLAQAIRFDLLPKYKFYVDFTDLTVSKSFATGLSTNVFTSFSELQIVTNPILLSNVVKSVEMPEVAITSETKAVGSTKISVISSNDIDSLVIDFYADIDDRARQMYYNWERLMFNSDDNTQLPRLYYERDIRVIVFDRYNIPKVIRSYHGCSPRNLQKTRIDYAEDGLADIVSITFEVNNGMTIQHLGIPA